MLRNVPNSLFSSARRVPKHVRLNSSSNAHLGIRKKSPPDSHSPPDPLPPKELSDQEWEVKTGRALRVLQETLPNFFSVGLITATDRSSGDILSSSSIPFINANPLDVQNPTPEPEPIYSPKIRLSYTPPARLPAPFPEVLHVEGLPLYLASSMFVRHTMNALCSDLDVKLKKVVINTPSKSQDEETPTPKYAREKSVLIGLQVTGTMRVGGAPGEWEVTSTYSFSSLTGCIDTHLINEIHPAPHFTVYDSLRNSLGKVFGVGFDPRPGEGAGAACHKPS